MAETSSIEWTDATVSFWWGCSKVSPGCDNCYAEQWNAFRGNGEWGPGAPRLTIKGARALLQRVNRSAPTFMQQFGRLPRVFMHSMSDVFDNEIDDNLRFEALNAAEAAALCHVIMLTKRLVNVERMVPSHWLEGHWPKNVGLVISVCTQKEANRDVPKLCELKQRFGIPWVGISMEPMLEPITLTSLSVKWGEFDALSGTVRLRAQSGSSIERQKPAIDWVIVGGESGKKHQATRPLHPAWVQSVQRACGRAGVAFFFKQWGDWLPDGEAAPAVFAELRLKKATTVELHADPNPFATVRFDTRTMYRAGKNVSGALLNGTIWQAFPKELMR